MLRKITEMINSAKGLHSLLIVEKMCNFTDGKKKKNTGLEKGANWLLLYIIPCYH